MVRLLGRRGFSAVSRTSPWTPQWVNCSDSRRERSSELAVVSWNILGPLQGESEKHFYANPKYVRWSNRKKNILTEMKRIGADIYCLQEVSLTSLADTFVPHLKEFDIQCAAFAPSTNPSLNFSRHGIIGCAIFVNTQRLEILQSRRVTLKDFASNILQCSESGYFNKEIQGKWHSLAIAQMRLRATGQSFVVGNTHLFWDPVRSDIKSVQAFAAVNAIQAFCEDPHITRQDGILLCGDFNSGPIVKFPVVNERHCTAPSAVFDILRRGCLLSSHYEHPDSVFARRKKFFPGLRNPNIGALRHNNEKLTFRNIFDSCESNKYNCYPLFTSKTDDFQGWIDHVWVNSGIKVKGLLMSPAMMQNGYAKSIDSFPPIPNKNFPSDHLPIGCRISLC